MARLCGGDLPLRLRFPRLPVLANWKSFVAVMLYSPITDAA
jgi:hypothetical protein